MLLSKTSVSHAQEAVAAYRETGGGGCVSTGGACTGTSDCCDSTCVEGVCGKTCTLCGTVDASYDRGSTFRSKWFLKDGAPEPQIVGNWALPSLRDTLDHECSYSGSSFIFFQICFWERYLAPILRSLRKREVRTCTVARVYSHTWSR